MNQINELYISYYLCISKKFHLILRFLKEFRVLNKTLNYIIIIIILTMDEYPFFIFSPFCENENQRRNCRKLKSPAAAAGG